MLKARCYTVGKTKHVVSKKLYGSQNKTCYKQEVTRLTKQNMLQKRSYTVGKIKHVVSKELHGWQAKRVIREMVYSWQNKTSCNQEVTQLAKQNML